MRLFIFPVILTLMISAAPVLSAQLQDEPVPIKALPIQLTAATFQQVKALYKPMKKSAKQHLKAIRRLGRSPCFARIDFEKELREVTNLGVDLANTSRNRLNIRDWCAEVKEYKRFNEYQASLCEGTIFDMPDSEEEIYSTAQKIIHTARQELFTVAGKVSEIMAQGG